MSMITTKLAQRASKDTSLIASLIDRYGETMNLHWEEIANYLWIDNQKLAKLALCRRPNPSRYDEDISQVADYVGMDEKQLTDFIRNAESASIKQQTTGKVKSKPSRTTSHRSLAFVFATVIFVLILLSAFVFLQPTSASASATVLVIRGDATVFSQGNAVRFLSSPEKIIPAGELITVQESDTIQVSKDGLARLKLLDGSTVDLLAGSKLHLTQVNTSEQSYQVQLGLLTGRAVSRVRRLLNVGDSFEIITPSSTISVRGTEFAVEVISPTITYVACNEGIVQVRMGDQAVQVTANQEVTAVVGKLLEVVPLSIWEEPDPAPAVLETLPPLPTPTVINTPTVGVVNPAADAGDNTGDPTIGGDTPENPPPGQGGELPSGGAEPPGQGEPPGHQKVKGDHSK